MKLTVNVSEKMLREMVESAGLKFVSLKALRKAMKTKKFQKEIADDMLNVWCIQNDEGDGDYYEVVKGLFEDLVIDPNDDGDDD